MIARRRDPGQIGAVPEPHHRPTRGSAGEEYEFAGTPLKFSIIRRDEPAESRIEHESDRTPRIIGAYLPVI